MAHLIEFMPLARSACVQHAFNFVYSGLWNSLGVSQEVVSGISNTVWKESAKIEWNSFLFYSKNGQSILMTQLC